MKKLLLVMLVPVLVLGVIGCGKVQNGDANPIILQGVWEATNNSPDLIIGGNQITLVPNEIVTTYVGNIALRTSFSGDHGGLNDAEDGILIAGKTFKIEFFWFDKPYTKIGEIECTATEGGYTTPSSPPKPMDGFNVDKVNYETYYQNVMLPNKGEKYKK